MHLDATLLVNEDIHNVSPNGLLQVKDLKVLLVPKVQGSEFY